MGMLDGMLGNVLGGLLGGRGANADSRIRCCRWRCSCCSRTAASAAWSTSSARRATRSRPIRGWPSARTSRSARTRCSRSWAPADLGDIAAKLGISTGAAAGGLASILPQIIDRMTPQGQIPDRPERPGGAGARDAAEDAAGVSPPPLDQPRSSPRSLLGIVEGLTEFLPVSSTGHLIVAGSLLGYTGEQAKVFEIVIQAGAILAVCWEYRVRLLAVLRGLASDPRAQRFAVNLAVAFMPAAVLGLAFGKAIKAHLFAPVPVACAFVAGAFVILWAERRQKARPDAVRITSVDDMRWPDALKVGLAQALALVPGTSRSGATIIGGMLFGLSRTAATEFSFFLAIPTLFAATGYEVLKNRHLLAAPTCRRSASASPRRSSPRSCACAG